MKKSIKIPLTNLTLVIRQAENYNGTKGLIVKAIGKKPMNYFDLSRQIEVSEGTVRQHCIELWRDKVVDIAPDFETKRNIVRLKVASNG